MFSLIGTFVQYHTCVIGVVIVYDQILFRECIPCMHDSENGSLPFGRRVCPLPELSSLGVKSHF